MRSKEKYYGLDEIGFIGTQEKRSKSQIKKDLEETALFMKNRKSGKVIPLPERRLTKAR